MDLLPSNLPALAFGLIALPVGLLITKFILWPIFNITLVPVLIYVINANLKIIGFILGAFKKRSDDQSENKASTEVSRDFFDKIFDSLEGIFIKFFDLLSNRFFIIKTIIFLIIPFSIINYYLESLVLNVPYNSYNSELIYNASGAMIGAIIVSLFAAAIAKSMGIKFSRSVPISFFSFLSIGIVHYFI